MSTDSEIRCQLELPDEAVTVALGRAIGRHMRVGMVDYLRPEMTFDDMAAMRGQMVEDSRRARVILDWEDWDPAWPASPFMSVTHERD